MAASSDLNALRQAIRALEQQRASLGDAVVDSALAPLRDQLTKLDTAPPRSGEQVLKQVSVLFLDVVGSTTLAQRLDPEEVSAVMDGCLRRCTTVVQQHGGKVLQYAGDSLLAAFGAEVSREDDAERAVQAGLALLALGREVGHEVRAQHMHDGFDVRVGVHTGSVLLGGGVDQDGTIRGIAVNIAARMEQTAPAGALRISQDTYTLVRGIFDVEPQPPLTVKGVDTEITSYLVRRAKPRAFDLGQRGQAQRPTPLIGRDTELAELTCALNDVIDQGRPQMRLLLAQAGLGKSRLMRELLHAAELHPRSCWLLLGRCHPSSELEPYGLLRAVLTWRLDIAHSDSAETARGKLIAGLMPALTSAGRPPEEARVDALCLGHLVGFDHSGEPELADLLSRPRQLRERALATVRQLLQGLAGGSGSPVVMLLEDLHWADDASLDWLAGLLDAPPALPLLLAMSARPSLHERRPGWGGPPSACRLLSLTPLAAGEREALTAALLHRLPDPPAELLALIDGHAEGNPFYAEELVKMLFDQAVLVADDGEDSPGGPWRVDTERLRPDLIPPTLTGVLQARLDALATQERHALQMASVIGPVFWDEALASLAPHGPEAIDPLQRKAMVVPRPHSVFEDTAERSFHHHLLHQVTYGTVLKAARQEGHARAAAWLQARAGDRSDEILAITAEHFERAGDHAKALEWFARASQAARSRDAIRASVAHCERALALPPAGDPRLRIEVMIRQADLYDALGRYDDMAGVLDRAMAEIESIGDKRLRLKALGSQVLLADRVGDLERGWALAEDLAKAAEDANMAGRAALAWGNLAWISKERGQLDRAREQVARALGWARTRGRQAMKGENLDLYEVQLLQVEAAIHDDDFDDDRCEQALRASLRCAEPILFERRAKTNALLHLAILALRHVDLDAAGACLAEAEAIAEAIPVPRTLHACRRERASLHLLRREWALAEPIAIRAASDFEALGAQVDSAHCWLVAASARRQAGDPVAAADACREALTHFQAGGASEGATIAQVLLAHDLQRMGEGSEAIELLRSSLASLAHPGRLELNPQALEAHFAAWSVLSDHGDALAPEQLERAWQALQRHLGRRADAQTRTRMLRQIPHHRQIEVAWLTHGPAAGRHAP